MTKNGRLTQRQDVFCLEYFKLGNATEAALIAGYSPRNTRVIAAINLSKLNIQQRIDQLRQKAEDATIATVQERQQVLTEIVRGRLADFPPNMTQEQMRSAALQEVKHTRGIVSTSTTVKLHSPTQAIDLLNKMDKIYTDGPVVNIDQRKIEIIVETPEAKRLTQEILDGEGT